MDVHRGDQPWTRRDLHADRSQLPGHPSLGSWLNDGLGAETENLPGFVVMVTKNKGGLQLVSRVWGSGLHPGA